jgi:hypothetical protein
VEGELIAGGQVRPSSSGASSSFAGNGKSLVSALIFFGENLFYKTRFNSRLVGGIPVKLGYKLINRELLEPGFQFYLFDIHDFLLCKSGKVSVTK